MERRCHRQSRFYVAVGINLVRNLNLPRPWFRLAQPKTRANATVTLNAVNSAPTPLNKSFTVHGYTLLGDLLSGDSDPDGDSLNFNSIQTYPQHGSLFTSPTLQTPAYSPNSGYSGPDSFTYRICDSLGLCGTGTVTLTVLPNDGLENCGTGSCRS